MFDSFLLEQWRAMEIRPTISKTEKRKDAEMKYP
jgi:hypothetical protein